MSIEMALARHVVYRRITKNEEKATEVQKLAPFEYPECNGRPASSSYNWVLTDYIGYRFAKLLRITDEDIRQKQKNSSIIEPK